MLSAPPPAPDDLLKRLRASITSYESTLVTEADRRLYVRPLLEAGDLLQLHARHCYVHTHGSPAHPLVLGRALGVTEQRVRQVDARCRAADALDGGSNITTAVGRVAVGVVQYVHHQWADDHFPDLLAEAPARAQLSLKHPDAESLQPRLYGLVVGELRRLDSLLVDPYMAAFVLAIESAGRSLKPAELAVAMGVSSKTIYERARAARAEGLITRIDLDLTRKGRQKCDQVRHLTEDWTRTAALAMTAWSMARAS